MRKRRETFGQWRLRVAAWCSLTVVLVGSCIELVEAAEPTPEAAAQLEQARQYIADHEASQQAAVEPDSGGLFSLFSGTEKAPVVEPFTVPGFSGAQPEHRRPAAALRLGRGLDADGLFAAIGNCYPAASHWNPELTLQARANTDSGLDATGAAIADHYIGLVASLPLWSASEKTRERDRELMRRQQAAELVGTLGQALAERGRAVREYGLYRALEARSALRVQQGLADTLEQVGYLAQVAGAHSASVKAHADIERTRLALVAQCRPDTRGRIDGYIKRLTALEPTQ